MSDFVGEFYHTVDSKGRMNIPAAFRKALAIESRDVVVITRGFEKCLAVYGFEGWERVKSDLRRLSPVKRKARQFIRTILSQMAESKVDNQGRITIPRKLLDKVGITTKVVVIGALDRFEVWSPDMYNEYMADAEKVFEEVAEELDL